MYVLLDKLLCRFPSVVTTVEFKFDKYRRELEVANTSVVTTVEFKFLPVV